MTDTFLTIDANSDEILFKEKNSKFFGYACPIQNEVQVADFVSFIRKKHVGAGHFCYAYQIGTTTIVFRTNDDNEPKNTAGTPIYSQIKSYGLTDILVVVVRYFGGTKLGTSGLISAYKTAAQLAIQASQIVEKTIDSNFHLTFEFEQTNFVMKIIKEKQAKILQKTIGQKCEIKIAIRKKERQSFFELLNNNHKITIKLLEY